jgi:hypothetical protein
MSQKLKSISIAGQKFEIDAGGTSAPLFSEVVTPTLNNPGVGYYDLKLYEGKTIKLMITEVHDGGFWLDLPKNCYLIIPGDILWDGGAFILAKVINGESFFIEDIGIGYEGEVVNNSSYIPAPTDSDVELHILITNFISTSRTIYLSY